VDGWEEGLVDSFLGRVEEDEEAWFRDFGVEEDHMEVGDECDDTFPEAIMELKTIGQTPSVRLSSRPIVKVIFPPFSTGSNPGSSTCQMTYVLCCTLAAPTTRPGMV